MPTIRTEVLWAVLELVALSGLLYFLCCCLATAVHDTAASGWSQPLPVAQLGIVARESIFSTIELLWPTIEMIEESD